jgi:gluconolactonase
MIVVGQTRAASVLVVLVAVAIVVFGADCGKGGTRPANDASDGAGATGTAGAGAGQMPGTSSGGSGVGGEQVIGTASGGTGTGGRQAIGTGGRGVSRDGGVDIAGGGDGPATVPDSGSEAPASEKTWSCPVGPFEAPMAGPSQEICPGFKVRYSWNEGPTWIASQKAFFFSNFVIRQSGPGDMIKFTPETGQCEFFIEGNGCNGLGVAPNGNIIAACQTPRALMEYDPLTKQGKVLADMAEGKLLDSPNDLIAHANGTIYFSNPTFELGGRPPGLGNALLQLSPAGAVTVIATGALNGIALSPDQKLLYVVGMGVWDLDGQGVLSNRRTFTLGSDGIAMDCAGNIYDNGGNIRNPQGQNIGKFPAGTNMAFGGPDAKTLLVVGGVGAHTVQMNVPGLP